jgi:hypothetical protein
MTPKELRALVANERKAPARHVPSLVMPAEQVETGFERLSAFVKASREAQAAEAEKQPAETDTMAGRLIDFLKAAAKDSPNRPARLEGPFPFKSHCLGDIEDRSPSQPYTLPRQGPTMDPVIGTSVWVDNVRAVIADRRAEQLASLADSLERKQLASLADSLERKQLASLADSLERKQLVFQLGAMGEISRETAYNSLGIDDVVAEQKKRLEEDLEIQRAVIADRRAEQLAEALQVCNAEQRISTLKQLISLL